MGFTVGVQDYSSQMGYYIDSYCDSCSHAKEHLELSAEKPDDNIGPLIVTYTIFGGFFIVALVSWARKPY